jgi:anti-anti-sigma factor
MDADIVVSDDQKTASVRLVGDIDLATRAEMESAIAAAAEMPGVAAVVVDLAAVDFLDSSGIGGLVRGRRLADAAGIAYRIQGATGIVYQALDLTGVWAYLSGDQPAVE